MDKTIMMRILTACTLLLVVSEAVDEAKCRVPKPEDTLFINESTPIGFVLYAAPDVTKETEWRLTVLSPGIFTGYLENFLTVSRSSQTFAVSLARQLDVETIFREKGVMVSEGPIKLSLECSVKRTNAWANFKRTMFVASINEYPPKFLERTVKVLVKEGTPIGTSVFNLQSSVTDEDRDFRHNQFYGFPKYASDSKLFEVDETGIIRIGKELDYEHGEYFYQMAVTIVDNRNWTASAVVNIIVENVNDNIPNFQYIGCYANCYDTYYIAQVSGCTLGYVTRFSYGPINAIDEDREPVNYRIIYASPYDARNFVQIDQTTGHIYISRFLHELNYSPIGFVLEAYDTQKLTDQFGIYNVNSQFTVLMLYIDSDVCERKSNT